MFRLPMFAPDARENPNKCRLEPGSRVAVLGGGPAGSFFAYFLLDFAQKVGIDGLSVDIIEPRDYSIYGSQGCNMCAGIVSESLVQFLAAEGIELPPTVVQRGIDSYILHMDEGNTRIETPFHERRIATVYRGAGPRGTTEKNWDSLDDYLISLARSKGAQLVKGRVEEVSWQDDRPQIQHPWRLAPGLRSGCRIRRRKLRHP